MEYSQYSNQPTPEHNTRRILANNVDKAVTPPSCNPCEVAVRADGRGRLHIVPHLPHAAARPSTKNIVWAKYWDTYENEGWDKLEISVVQPAATPSSSAPMISDSIKARATGYAEGHLQANLAYQYWTNYRWTK